MLRLRRAAIGLALVVVAAVELPGGAAVARSSVPPSRIIGRDPYTNTDAYHETAIGPAMFANGSTIVAAFQMGRFPGSGATNLGFATSADAGRSWTGGTLPATTTYADPPGPYQWASQASVGYSAKQGMWLIAGVGQAAHRDVFVSRSVDGTAWDAPIVVSSPNVFFGYESPTIACDNRASSPYYGNCYLKWDALYDLYAFVSHDGGLTWEESGLPRLSESFGGAMVVQPSGAVIMVMGDEYTEICCTYTSHDGGASYRFYSLHPGLREHTVNGNLRAYNFGSLAADDGGDVYLALFGCQYRPRCRTNDILVARGKDGWHWGPYRRVPIDPVTGRDDHFLPAIAVEPGTTGGSAHLAIAYWTYSDGNCTEATCRLSVGMIQSLDGGVTWGDPVHVAGPFSITWYPLQDLGHMVGDYSAIAFVPGGAVPIFAAARPSGCELGANDCLVAMAAPRAPVP